MVRMIRGESDFHLSLTELVGGCCAGVFAGTLVGVA